MRVIEYGHIKPKQIKCNHCGSILEYVNEDLKMNRIGLYQLQCPVCYKFIYKDDEGKELTR